MKFGQNVSNRLQSKVKKLWLPWGALSGATSDSLIGGHPLCKVDLTASPLRLPKFLNRAEIRYEANET